MCHSPITVTHSTGRHLVRCGNCVKCAIRRQQSWTLRCLLEQRVSGSASFVTLTYRDDTVPDLLDARHMQLFFKRLRRSTSASVRYFYCGEYGGKTGRPHWHAIVYGLPLLRRGLSQWPQWPHGHVHVGEVTRQSVSYVVRYTLKSWRGEHVVGMSRRPGIGLQPIRIIAGYMAQSQPELEAFPSRWTLNGRCYPLDQTAYDAAKDAYLEAGGVLGMENKAAREHRVRLFEVIGEQTPAARVDRVVRRYEQELQKGVF